MDAVKFLKTLCRMCNCECFNCEFRKRLSVFETCTAWRKTHPDEAVAIVEKWAKEHPVKTRQSEFLKILPNVGLEEGVIDVCPKATEKNAICFRLNCKVCKKDYWLAEVK